MSAAPKPVAQRVDEIRAMIRAHKRWDRIFAMLGLLSMMIGWCGSGIRFPRPMVSGGGSSVSSSASSMTANPRGR